MRSPIGIASAPTVFHSSPILTFDDTLISDMRLETLPSEGSVITDLMSTSLIKRRFSGWRCFGTMIK